MSEELNEMAAKRTIQRINVIKSCFFKKINKNDSQINQKKGRKDKLIKFELQVEYHDTYQ
jgi:hypothetical protein